ncbi:MAG: hypothetical protein WCI74_17025, partial [Actinomycetes bacterium]
MTLTDSDGTTARFDAALTGLKAEAPGFSYFVSSAFTGPNSGPTGGTTAGLNLGAIASIAVAGNSPSTVAWDIDRIYALRTLAVPGEIVRYRLVVELPESTSPDFMVQDNLPAGVRFINDSSVRVAFVANGVGIASTAAGTGNAAVPFLTGTGLNLSGNGDTVSSFSLAVGSGNGLAIGEGTSFDSTVSSSLTDARPATDTYNDGTDPIFRLGNLVNSDDDADAEYIVIEFNALVTNDRNAGTDDSTQQAGVTLDNTFQTHINSSTVNTQVGSTTSANDFSRVVIVEPQINDLAKKVLTAPLDAGDTVVYEMSFYAGPLHPSQYLPTVRVATTVNLTATYNATGGPKATGRFTGAPAAVDGRTLAEGDLVLVQNQTDAKQNGIYKVVDQINGIWDRASSFDENAEISLGYRVYVIDGATQKDFMFSQDTAGVALNNLTTGLISFSRVSSSPVVKVATTANLANFASDQITGVALTMDGATLALNQRVLVKDQTTGSQNGVYVVTAIAGTATLTRAD